MTDTLQTRIPQRWESWESMKHPEDWEAGKVASRYTEGGRAKLVQFLEYIFYHNYKDGQLHTIFNL